MMATSTDALGFLRQLRSKPTGSASGLRQLSSVGGWNLESSEGRRGFHSPVDGWLRDEELEARARDLGLPLEWTVRPASSGHFRIRHLALALGRKADTLRRWEARRQLPRTQRFRGQRSYERRQILLAQLIAQEEALLDSRRIKPESTGFAKRVFDAWMCVPD